MMIAADGYYNYTGEDEVPDDAIHVTIDESVRVIPAEAFACHPNIVEVIGPNVERVEEGAFDWCPSLRRVIMPGVEVVEHRAFDGCEALTDVECAKLERIGNMAFLGCVSLTSINLLSAKIVERYAFADTALTEAKFGSKLETIEEGAFADCTALKRITIPLKDGMITDDDTFQGCENLERVDIVEGELHETIAALQLKEWKNDMNEEIVSINQILDEDGGNARAIRTWIRSVLRKIVHFKAEHQRFLTEEVATSLQLALPQDIVKNNVLPFLELPSYTFEVEDDEEE